jgi:motility quorum-sensing regulator / GCU-specific mRNA interferase toxin
MVALLGMEKFRPTYDLNAIRMTFGAAKGLAISTSALRSAAVLGFDRDAIVETVTGIDRGMFYKSMTTFDDHRVWQDVYHVPSGGVVLYIKFQADLMTEFRIMAFKER